jgi:hypothetical protein
VPAAGFMINIYFHVAHLTMASGASARPCSSLEHRQPPWDFRGDLRFLQLQPRYSPSARLKGCMLEAA